MNTLTLWNNPFADFDSLMKRTFGGSWFDVATPFAPEAEVVRDGDDALVKLELPGIDAIKRHGPRS
jgi:HSP20 family molecular chaperone IbpA